MKKLKEPKDYKTIKEIGADHKYCLCCGASVWSPDVEFLESPPNNFQDTLLCVSCLDIHVTNYFIKYPKTSRTTRYKTIVDREIKRRIRSYNDITKFLDPKIDEEEVNE